MKIYNKILILATASFTLASCVKLDTVPQGSTITSEQKANALKADPSKISAGVAGIASMFNTFGNALGEDYHCDFGHPAVMLFTDSRSGDMIGVDDGYNWFSEGASLEDHIYNSNATYLAWRTYYNQIYSCNLITGSIDSETDDEKSKFYLAQALAVRAFDYLQLAQLYQFTYKGHETAPCVPLITEKTADASAQNGAKRATVQEVYEQIVSDLDAAIVLLTDNKTKRDDKRYVDINVCYGLRARVALNMQDWKKAAECAKYVIDKSGVTPLSAKEAGVPGFHNQAIHNWLWAIVVAETERTVTTGICNFPSHMGSFCYGYSSVGAYRMISKKLFNTIKSDDVRRKWFLDGNKKSAGLDEAHAAQVAAYKCPAYTQVKFEAYKGVMAQSTNANDIPLMRIEEMYLILAEAQAMDPEGSAAKGAATLTDFVKQYRCPSYSFTSSDAKAVQDEVLFQRKIELWGEGLSWADVMRLECGIDRRGGGWTEKWIYKINADDPYMLYMLPKGEIEANPALTDADNNPAGAAPDPVADE